ncbi:hypothetical protein AURDEDRAFT_171579 [Auricularia subglabra TFB-10046 SS5]|nr:hypothetical protein AURDEDRAFT_171579 [Auricularia subglabra TFB-10046 SS5]
MSDQEINLTRYVRVAAIAFFTWDWVITFDEEVSSIWHSKWTRTKILFLLLRFLTLTMITLETSITLASGPSESACRIYPLLSGLWVVAVVAIVQIILQLRIYAMYDLSSTLLHLNGGIFVLQLAAMLFLTVKVSRIPGRDIPSSDRMMESCYSTLGFRGWIVWVPAVIFETWLAALAARKLSESPEHRSMGLLNLMVRDSMIMFVGSIVWLNATLIALESTLSGLATSGVVGSAGCVAGTRLILSIRTNARDMQDNVSLTEIGSGTLDFMREANSETYQSHRI